MVKEVVSPDANTIFGTTIDENYNDRMIVTIVATGFEGSRFENATAQNSMQRQGGAQIPNIAKPQDTGNFDRNRFNDFVAGKPTMMSLFEKNDNGMDRITTPLMQQSVQQSKPEFIQPKRESYTDEELWKKLQASNNHQPKSTNEIENELDRKYGITPNIQQPQISQPVNIERTAKLDSNIKVDNAEIPPFLRRKFNK